MPDGELWIEYIPLSKLKEWPRNPKEHADEDIDASIDEFGFTDPITIDETSGKMVAGHGRLARLLHKHKDGEDIPENIKLAEDGEWLAPVVRGNKFADDEAVERYLLTVNQLTIKGGWNNDLLEVMVKQLKPTGFDVVEEAKSMVDSLPPPPEVPRVDLPRPNTASTPPVVPPEESEKESTSLDFEQVPGILRGVFDIDDNVIFESDAPYGIPKLKTDKLCESIPSEMKTWAGHTVTPDDGESWYLYSFGASPANITKMPWSRAILCFFSRDDLIETWWNKPGFRAGQMLTLGVKTIIVPDFSLYDKVEMKDGRWINTPKATLIYQVYRAQWMGRFFQEVGFDVIPRFEYFFPHMREFSMAGVPVGSHVIATQLHTGFDDEHIPLIKESLKLGVEKFKPQQFLFYVSDRGAEIVNDCKLPCEVVMVHTIKKFAKPKDSYKVTDPYLKELRRRGGKGFERAKTTGGS